MARPRCKFIGLTRDWIDARVPMTWPHVERWFPDVIGGEVVTFTPPGRAGYRSGLKAVEGYQAGAVSIMGDNPSSVGWSMLTGTGSAAEWVWNVAAHAFPVVQANRVDAALDFHCSQRAFDRMIVDLTAITKAEGLRPHPVGDADWGRTCYVNWPRKSKHEKSGNEKAAMWTGRLYEKGKEMDQDPEWRRFEVVARPDKPLFKERMFNLEPSEIIGSPEWSRAFLQTIGYTDAVKPGRASPFARTAPVAVDAKVAKRMSAISHMGEQYGEAVRDLVRLIGEDEARRIVELALFRPVVVQEDGREISGPGLIRREAQQRWNDVFRDDLQRKVHDAGDGGKLYN
ncbi:MAG: hypothetical protein EOO77_04850 [Oxalobacteraceae bacterium]|nr:MAG: hypothetical protein EOO77_04850 [Oxalobacteraceae bacterium]